MYGLLLINAINIFYQLRESKFRYGTQQGVQEAKTVLTKLKKAKELYYNFFFVILMASINFLYLNQDLPSPDTCFKMSKNHQSISSMVSILLYLSFLESLYYVKCWFSQMFEGCNETDDSDDDSSSDDRDARRLDQIELNLQQERIMGSLRQSRGQNNIII